MNIPTPHIEAKKGDFAKTVLMPGDPLRARFIAEHYLEDAVLVNSVRQMSGYTGTYKGKRVSVMASGMGMPSMGIYSYELFNGYDVENIIRIGTAGALREDLHLRDLVFGIGACTNSNFAAQYQLPGSFAPTASFPLLRKAVEAAEKREGLHYMVGSSMIMRRGLWAIPQAIFSLRRRPPDSFFGYILQRFQPGCELAENGRTGRGNGSGGIVYECGENRKTGSCDLYNLGQHCYRRGDKLSRT